MTTLDPRLPTAHPATLIIAALRSWRHARRLGHSTQPSLARTLAAQDGLLLTPVLDGLICVYATALGRPIECGDALDLSRDEHILLGLLEGSQPQACLACSDGVARTLHCALCSTRIMLDLWPRGDGTSH